MIKQIIHLISSALFIATLAGCASAPSRFYTLNSTATANNVSPASYAVAVGPVSIPASVDHPQFTVQIASNRVELSEFNRWAAPLNDAIARVVIQDLTVLLGTPRVAASTLANFDATYRVTIDMQRFESVRSEARRDDAAIVEAVWVVRRTDGAVRSGATRVREPAGEGGFDALAAAHSRALAKVSGDIATAIRAAADEKP
jgi:uncharacterized lipoprotein YmbA